MQIKTSHLLGWLLFFKKAASVGEDIKTLEPSRTVGGNAHWCSPYGKQCGDSSKN